MRRESAIAAPCWLRQRAGRYAQRVPVGKCEDFLKRFIFPAHAARAGSALEYHTCRQKDGRERHKGSIAVSTFSREEPWPIASF